MPGMLSEPGGAGAGPGPACMVSARVLAASPNFATAASWDWMSITARARLKICVLDALGCAIAALGARPIQALRAHTDQFASGA